jgi:hypothetical protein
MGYSTAVIRSARLRADLGALRRCAHVLIKPDRRGAH